MKPRNRNFLAMLDDTVRWTGMPDRVADQMTDDPDRKHRPMRWVPIGPIAFSFALLVLSLAWPSALQGFSLAGIIGVLVAFWGGAFAMMSGIHARGPLGSPSLEDDEREAALRKDSFLACLLLLAVLNCLGQPLITILSHWQHWQVARIASVVTTAFMLNATLLGCFPTLYASWKMAQLPKE